MISRLHNGNAHDRSSAAVAVESQGKLFDTVATHLSIMPAATQPTVERLDKPSAYYQGRVYRLYCGVRSCFSVTDTSSRIKSVSTEEKEMMMMLVATLHTVKKLLKSRRTP